MIGHAALGPVGQAHEPSVPNLPTSHPRPPRGQGHFCQASLRSCLQKYEVNRCMRPVHPSGGQDPFRGMFPLPHPSVPEGPG